MRANDRSWQLKTLFGAALALLAAALVLSISVGKFPISVEELIAIIQGKEVDELTAKVFWTLRLPRTIMVAVAGIALGMAGSIYQTIFKNPLASPDIIGVASGANLGAALTIVFWGSATFTVAIGAFAGGLLAVGMVIMLVQTTRINSTATYILSGIVITSIAEAAIMTLKFFVDRENDLAAMDFWAMGSFGSVTMSKLLVILPIFAIGVAGMILLRRQVFLLSLNDDESRMLGLNVGRIRLLILAFSTLAVSSIICVTGLISFIGLIAPHIARLMLRRNTFATCAMSAIIGALVLVGADCLARTLYATELPISILTTFIGVPFLLYFMCKKKKGVL